MTAKAKPRKSQEPELVRRDGGLCPAFVNTASVKREPIETYADLLAWGQRCGALGGDDARRLERAARERTDVAAEVLVRAQALRQVMERILLALAAAEEPSDADVEALNGAIGPVLARRRLVPAADGYHRWDWDDRGGDDLDRMLWPVVLSAAEVLTSWLRHRVGRCVGEGCDLLFVDRTAGSHRKWCDMKDCGRRVRDHKHYLRKKQKIAKEREAKRRSHRPSGSDSERTP